MNEQPNSEAVDFSNENSTLIQRQTVEVTTLPQVDTTKKWSRKKKIILITSVISCLLIAILVFLILLFVVAPRVVQKFMNDAELKFVSIEISNPNPTNFTLSSHCVLSNAGVVSSSIGEFNVTIEFDGKLLGGMVMPTVQTKGEAPTEIIVNSLIDISNTTVFNAFTRTLVTTNGTAVWHIFGNATVHALGMSFKAFFDKNVTISGMQGLSNVTVNSFDLPRNNPDTKIGGVEMFVNVTMFNPSVVTMNMGSDVTFDFKYQGTSLGQLVAHNVSLTPGANFLQTKGYLKPQDMTTASVFMSNYMLGIDSLVEGQGLHAGEGEPQWVHEMVRTLRFTTVFQGGQNFPPVISDIVLGSMNMNVLSGDSVLIGSAIQSSFFTPFNFPLDIIGVVLSQEMALDGRTFAAIEVPYQPASCDQKRGLFWTSFDGVPMKLMDMEAFSALVNSLAMSDGAKCEFRGYATATVASAMGNITLSNLPFKQFVTISGMQGMSNVTVLGFDLPGDNTGPEGGVEMLTSVDMYNPSFVTMALGADVVMDISFEGSFVARVTAPNVTLFPGSNVLSAKGYLKPENISSASVFISNYMGGINSTVSGHGVSVGNSSDPTTSWMQTMIRLLNFNTTFPGAQGLQTVSGIVIDSMTMNMVSDDDIRVSAQISSGFKSPFAFPLSITRAQLTQDLIRNDVALARLEIPAQPARSNQTLGLMWTQFDDVPMRVLHENEFSQLVDDLTNMSEATVIFQGTATVTAETAMGNITIFNIAFSASVTLQGMNSFAGQTVQIPNLAVNGGSPNYLELGLTLVIYDPSYLSMNAENISFVTVANNEIYINQTTSTFSLEAGQNNTLEFTSQMIKTQESEAPINSLLTSYVRGDPVMLSLQGRKNDCRIRVMRPALENLKIFAVAQSPPIKMVSYFHMSLTWDIFKMIIPTRINMTNPWNATIKIVGMNQKIYSGDKYIAELNEDITNNPVVLNPASNIVSEAQPVKLVTLMSKEEIESLFTQVPLSITGTISVIIGDGFSATIEYNQTNVPASFRDQ